ncbi:GrpB family protein [Staphylococcus pettenkoferi]|uniref:GrpB family protein n=1 Tax=Staphylococcus pettenkoferi TaxID=170573 RepID=UPI00066CE412|nr:GrpB family protein [Staphylococcus pettenkoferi]MDK7114522.1 GrpB family protein [Staphylococcus pettenkoferi]MDK7283755.1 GrpB family protein [Staphylococcus pettenkoferi]
MYSAIQPFIKADSEHHFKSEYEELRHLLFNLLDSPVKSTHHIGGTSHFNYPTEPILDILVGVDNLHDITALDEKRLNYAGFYRLHHPYKKKVVMAKFNNLIDLKQEVRLHIIQRDTRLFKQYLEMDEALAHNDDIAQHFSDKKSQILKHVERISDYEQRKQQVLDKIYKKYVADSK